MLQQLLIFDLAVFGLAFVLGYSEITLGVREFYRERFFFAWFVKWAECPACNGFWFGLIGWWIGLADPSLPWYIVAFQACGANLLLGRFSGLIEEG